MIILYKIYLLLELERFDAINVLFLIKIRILKYLFKEWQNKINIPNSKVTNTQNINPKENYEQVNIEVLKSTH